MPVRDEVVALVCVLQLDPVVERAEIVAQVDLPARPHPRQHTLPGPRHLHRLVDGVVHELAPAALEQPELPVRIEAAVTDPVAPEDVPPRYPVAVRGLTSALEHPSDRSPELGRDLLVRVDGEDPVAGRLFEGEVLLAGEPGPRPDPDAVGKLARDLDRLVARLGVHHDQFIGPGQALEAVAQALFLVERDDDRRDAEPGHGCGGREVGAVGGWPETRRDPDEVCPADSSAAMTPASTASTSIPASVPSGLWSARRTCPQGPLRSAAVGP